MTAHWRKLVEHAAELPEGTTIPTQEILKLTGISSFRSATSVPSGIIKRARQELEESRGLTLRSVYGVGYAIVRPGPAAPNLEDTVASLRASLAELQHQFDEYVRATAGSGHPPVIPPQRNGTDS